MCADLMPGMLTQVNKNDKGRIVYCDQSGATVVKKNLAVCVVANLKELRC